MAVSATLRSNQHLGGGGLGGGGLQTAQNPKVRLQCAWQHQLQVKRKRETTPAQRI